MTVLTDVQQYPLGAVAHPTLHRGQVLCAILILVGMPTVLILGHQAGLLRLAFPALSLAIGAFLLWRSKPHYVGLTFWLWFVTPFLGRMADYQSGYTPANPVEIAPYLVAGLAVIPLLANLRCLTDRGTVPYACALAAIFYGAVFGLVTLPLFNVLRALLNWLVPVIFGLFIYQNREFYPEFRRVIEKSFLYGVLILGAYGIYQFFVLPEWDRGWMLHVQMNSFGEIDPMKTRAFSTMNAPAIFAAAMATGLLLLFNSKQKLRLLAAAFGFVSLIMTLSRSSWLSLVAGGVYLLFRLGMRARVNFAIASLACIAFMLAATQVPGVDEVVETRMRTFSQPSQDVSYLARIEGHQRALREIAEEPWGEGIGSTDTNHNTEGDDDMIGPHDSTLLEFLYSLGWVGTFIYLLGLGYLLFQVIRHSRRDPFVLASHAILIGFVAQSMLNSVMLGVLGFMVWTFASMSLAASSSPETHERTLDYQPNPTASYATT